MKAIGIGHRMTSLRNLELAFGRHDRRGECHRAGDDHAVSPFSVTIAILALALARPVGADVKVHGATTVAFGLLSSAAMADSPGCDRAHLLKHA
jgi:hypothetical protein